MLLVGDPRRNVDLDVSHVVVLLREGSQCGAPPSSFV
jgi:hypothetical protein